MDLQNDLKMQYWGADSFIKSVAESQYYFQIPLESIGEDNIEDISIGDGHIFIQTQKDFYCFGQNEDFQIINQDIKRIDIPLLWTNDKLQIKKVFCGSSLTWALNDSQIVFGWGVNVFGQLGAGTAQVVREPIQVFPTPQAKADGEAVLDIVNKGAHSLLLTNKNKVYATGSDLCKATGLKKGVNKFQQISF